jgi:hypothetical protein
MTYALIALAIYLCRIKITFGPRDRFNDAKILPAQNKRFAFYDSNLAEKLQTATNIWHNQAIDAKTRYEGVGVAACSAAPSLICLEAVKPALEYQTADVAS